MSQNIELNLCPYVGLVGDAQTRCAFATTAHRCYRWGERYPIDLAHQELFCLTDRHPNCPIYTGQYRPSRRIVKRRTVAGLRTWPLAAGAVLLFVGLLFTALVALSQPKKPADRGGEATGSNGIVLPEVEWSEDITPMAEEATATSTPAILFFPFFLGTPTVSPVLGGVVLPTARAALTPTVTAIGTVAYRTPETTRTTAATVTPTRTLTPSPTVQTRVSPSPTPTPTAPAAITRWIVHIVGPGDTLYSVALRYGVSVELLRQVNNLREDDLIVVGQRLIVPIL